MNNVKKLTLKSPDFPEVLRNIPDPPEELFILGDIAAILASPRLAVVGSRKVTPYGKYATAKLASEAAASGVAIVSGLALGVDGLAHQAALDASGLTLAVLASGLDQITPVTNQHIARRILDKGGALISEYPPGTAPHKLSFIARNRLVSGISDAVLITEAAAKSGTMHTANFALEQGKTVMAVPGNINSSLSEGTNNLIKSGALPATSINDILLALGLNAANDRQTELFGNTEAETIILRLIQSGITDSAELQKDSGLDTPSFNQSLTMLEISGRIYALGAGEWTLK